MSNIIPLLSNVFNENNRINIYNIYQETKIFTIFSIILITIFIFLTPILKNNYKETNKITLFLNRKKEILNDRHLFEDNNLIEEIDIKKINYNKKIYAFLNDLTIMKYRGTWKNLYFFGNTFENNNGNLELEFKKSIRYKRGNNFTKSKIEIFFELRDGFYDDNYIKGNFSIYFDYLFGKLISMKNNTNNLDLININSSIDFSSCEILSECKKFHFNNLSIEIKFMSNEKIFFEAFNSRFQPNYNEVKFQMNSGENFTLDITSSIHNIKNDIRDVRNYSFMVLIIGLTQLYYVLNNLIIIMNDKKKCLGMDLVTICITIITKALITSCHFYRCIIASEDEISYYYGIISIVFVVDLSIFEIRTLYLCFKANFSTLNETNPNLFRQKLFIFACLFYIIIFTSLILCRLIVMNFPCLFFLFFSSWFFQIEHSIRKGTRPPMSYHYIISSTIAKIFFPIYLKSNPYNIFELKPSYYKTWIVVLTVLIEICIIFLQKNYGSRFLIPNYFQCNDQYNYYYDDISIEKHISKNPDCIICLGALKFTDENQELEKKIIQDNQDTILFLILNKIKQMIDIFKNYFRKKTYMITPCDHIFHRICLEKWLEFKNVCPYCKQNIPSLE